MLTGSFDFPASLFHTVFNRTVENFHTMFILGEQRELGWRENCFSAQDFYLNAQNISLLVE